MVPDQQCTEGKVHGVAVQQVRGLAAASQSSPLTKPTNHARYDGRLQMRTRDEYEG